MFRDTNQEILTDYYKFGIKDLKIRLTEGRKEERETEEKEGEQKEETEDDFRVVSDRESYFLRNAHETQFLR